MEYKDRFKKEDLEFKKSLSQLDKGLESLAAMLNKNGYGKVVYGIDDNASIVGVQNLGKETIKKIATRINEGIVPLVVSKITPINYGDKTIIVVEARGDKKPYACFGNYLIRVGSENKKITPEQLGDLFFTNSNLVSEKIESINQDLTFNGLKSLYISKGYTIDNSTFAKKYGSPYI